MTPNFFFGLLGFKLLMMHRNIHLKTNIYMKFRLLLPKNIF